MRILVSILTLFLFNLAVYSQTKVSAPTENFLLKISMEVRGLVDRNSCNLIYNRTLYADGRFEREDCQNTRVTSDGKKIPVKIEDKVAQEQVNQIIQFVEQSGFLTAEKKYVLKPIATDVGITTTIIYKNQNKEKQVVIENYDSYDLGIPCFLHLLVTRSPG